MSKQALWLPIKLGLLVAVVSLIGACSRASSERQDSSTPATGSLVLTLTDDTFQEQVLESSQPIAVHFWATWCPRCITMKPKLHELATEFEGKARVGEINIDTNTFVAAKYEIGKLPTVLIFQHGKVIERFEEADSLEQVRAKLGASEADVSQR